jgi:hypothetical protein
MEFQELLLLAEVVVVVMDYSVAGNQTKILPGPMALYTVVMGKARVATAAALEAVEAVKTVE